MATDRFRRWLRREREARDWTQAELARRVGTEAMSVSRWERGRNAPTLEQFALLCRALQASADAALGIRPRARRRKRRAPQGQDVAGAAG